MEFVRPSGEETLGDYVYICSVSWRHGAENKRRGPVPDCLPVEDVPIVAIVLCVHFKIHTYIHTYIYMNDSVKYFIEISGLSRFSQVPETR